MKLKFIFVFLLVTTTFLFSNSTNAGIVEDQLAKQALNDLKDVIKSIQPYSRHTARRLNQVRKGFKRGIVKDQIKCKPNGGKVTADILLIRADSISKERCTDESSNRVFTPRFEHCKSAADTKCVCSHKQHKNDPQCVAFFASQKEEKKNKNCIPQDIAEDAIGKVEQIANTLESLLAVDSDGNGISDICEDNL